MKKLFVLALALTIFIGELSINYLQVEAQRIVDERAQTLLQQARAAIGGTAAINAVNNLVSNGKISHTIKMPDNQERSAEGNFEMALETNGKVHKKIKLTFQGDPNAANSSGDDANIFFVENERTVLAGLSADGNAEPGRELHLTNDGEHDQQFMRRIETRGGVERGQNELARLMLGLLLKSPTSFDLVYNYVGESNVDGTLAEIIEATGGENFKTQLYLDKQTHLPLMISYRGVNQHPVMIFHSQGAGAPESGQKLEKVIVIKTPEGEKTIVSSGDPKISGRRVNAEANQSVEAGYSLPRKMAEEGEIQIRFSDFRQVGDLMLPHKITQYFNGQLDETTTIESYEVNAANITERFKDETKAVKIQ